MPSAPVLSFPSRLFNGIPPIFRGVYSQNLCGCFQFHGGFYPADTRIRAVDAGVLLWLCGLDVPDGNSMLPSPFHQLFTNVFRVVIDLNGAGLAAPFDDPIKAPDHTLGGQGKVDLNPQALSVEVVQHLEQPESPPIPKAIRHEIH